MISNILTVVTVISILTSKLSLLQPKSTTKVLSEVTYSLSNRYSNTYVNNVFSDNILLTIAYMTGKVKKGEKIAWDVVKTPSTDKIIIDPGKTFAFHDAVAEKYKGKVVATTNAHFSLDYGYLSDGWLVGDGVCHLASFINVASKNAGLVSEAPTRHDFANIPEVQKQDGVSIYYSPENPSNSAAQNLYVTNNHNKTIAMVFTHNNNLLQIKVEEIN